MRRVAIAAWICSALLMAREPVETAWIRAKGGITAASPEVHSLEFAGGYAVVQSSGISLGYLGPLQSPPSAGEASRRFTFRIPLHPEPQAGRHDRVPIDVVGAFVNGVPIYNQFEAQSYNGANLWHYDPIAARDASHPPAPGLLEKLIAASEKHSPLIGFALDGYPVYGPWGYAADGTLHRMRSSYRLRSILQRHDWPDGTQLTPEQYGPDVSDEASLGTFAEDYEFVHGSGDLDEFNGRHAVTPEFPDGTYAYFLSTDERGSLAYPYLVGPRFYGKTVGQASWPVPDRPGGLSYTIEEQPRAGDPVHIRFAAKRNGEPVRHFEYRHEKPIHLLIASSDLAEFDHVHPELGLGDVYEVTHTFPHSGRYRLWADFALPGEPPAVQSFDITVAGPARPEHEIAEIFPQRFYANEDVRITLNAPAGGSLQPYLGAWAHAIIVSDDLSSFSHAHPLGEAPGPHSHTSIGPAPETVQVMTVFPRAGTYKMWAQFQQAGRVVTMPYVMQVDPARRKHARAPAVPAAAIRVRVNAEGFTPAKITIPAKKSVTLAFTREDDSDCGSEVVFPKLKLHKDLPPGETVLVRLPPQPAGEIAFACGMGMYKGSIVAK